MHKTCCKTFCFYFKVYFRSKHQYVYDVCVFCCLEGSLSEAGDKTKATVPSEEQNDKTSAETDSDSELQFNEDLLCEEHG